MKKEEIIERYEYMIDYLATRLETWITPVCTKEDLIRDARNYAILQEALKKIEKDEE